ncbi:hypothetical protein FIU94_08955 [Sulfitobacter sp. THAF37]|uniref:hypothetical protein n=1 Tax=Sulfitobacter sp. THAF37 TaxID=2587855 RepID=UPI0012AA4051|nr:hypothetical protein [Sulfitobacter sp. THAF37]QFT58953.1 hypothetical protein FIU94_08955 [Sulfitobacter sp. THAF37]
MISVMVLLGACGPTEPQYDDPAWRGDTRQQPSTLTPGVSISGYANIGVRKSF